jgi:hypothetical protein
MMCRTKSALLALLLSLALVFVPVVDGAWAKDGSSGSGSSGSGSSGSSGGSGSGGSNGGGSSGSDGGSGNSGNGGGGDSNKGNQGVGSSTSSGGSILSLKNFRTAPERGTARLAKRKPPFGRVKVASSPSDLQSDLARAQKALKEAELKFNKGLANPKANLRKLEQAIRDAENATTAVGARLSKAASAN